MRFFRKKCRKILVIQKKVVPLHPQLRNNVLEIAMILGYGVMVTLQILVLSFLVRVRVSQLHHSGFFLKVKLGYGVMVTLQILVLSFLVRVRVSQLESIFHFERCFFRIFTFWRLRENFAFYYVLQKKRGCVMDLWHTLLFDFNKIFYLFSASIALIFSFTSFKSSLSFSTLRFISSTRLLPFLLAALRKPRLFS